MAQPASDTESKLQYLCGLPSLANFIASDRDRTTLLFGRFDELAARNLLYLQSELAELRLKQRAFDQEDLRGSDMLAKDSARHFAKFEEAAMDPNNQKQKERWELMLRIRSTLREYRETLVLESTMAALPPPSKTVWEAFKHEFDLKESNKNGDFHVLGGESASLYDVRDELVALRLVENHDRLTRFAQANLGFIFPVSKRTEHLHRIYSSSATHLSWTRHTF